MTWVLALPLVLAIPVGFAAGVLVGCAYFRAVRVTAELIVKGRSPLLALALTLGRLASLGGFLYAVVLAGAVPLIAASAGILIARTLMIRRIPETGA